VLIHTSASRHTTVTSHNSTHHLCSFTLHRHVTQPDPSSVLIHTSPSPHTTRPIICAHSRSTVMSHNRTPHLCSFTLHRHVTQPNTSSVLIHASASALLHTTGPVIRAHSRFTVTSHSRTHHPCSFTLHRHVTQPDPSSVLIHAPPSHHTTGPIIRAHSRFTVMSYNRTHHPRSLTLHRHITQPDPSSVLIHASPSRHTTGPIICAHSRFTVTSHNPTHHLCSFTLHRHVTQPDPSSVLIHAPPSRHTTVTSHTRPIICALTASIMAPDAKKILTAFQLEQITWTSYDYITEDSPSMVPQSHTDIEAICTAHKQLLWRLMGT